MEVRSAADLLDELDRLRVAVLMKAETIARDWDGWLERPDFAPSAANFAHYLALRRHDIRPLCNCSSNWQRAAYLPLVGPKAAFYLRSTL